VPVIPVTDIKNVLMSAAKYRFTSCHSSLFRTDSLAAVYFTAGTKEITAFIRELNDY
jgi:hypothetical protein